MIKHNLMKLLYSFILHTQAVYVTQKMAKLEAFVDKPVQILAGMCLFDLNTIRKSIRPNFLKFN